ncbi:MAG: hypothetical protein ACI8QT_000492 [Halioglobus sp.]|jgi:hypothetical protein
MSELGYHIHRRYRTAVRKLQTAVKGPKVHPAYTRAAHYFSDGWVLNFWQIMDPRQLDADFKQIINDGFNTIILVIPWREFQNNQFHPFYDSFYIKQLDKVMRAADRHDLSVLVRVAYSHQIPERAALSGLTQAQRLLTDKDTQKVWLDYLARVFDICHGYRSFRYAFLSWEEFWHAFAHWQHYPLEFRTKLARDIGFKAYLDERGVRNIDAVPGNVEPEHEHYHAFINHRIAQMYQQALTVFPRLSMEIRVDKDRVRRADGEVEWLSNDSYEDIAGSRLTYWAPFMGASNKGETLPAARAVELLDHMLDEITDQGIKPNHIIDQFNFVDEAPKFKGIHAEIDSAEISHFLHAAAPLLASKSTGYGVWAYRDYRQNLLYNSRFLMGMRGWEQSSGSYSLLRKGGVRLGSSAILRQVLPPRVAGLQSAVPFDHFTLRIDCLCTITALHRLSVKINAANWIKLEPSSTARGFTTDIPVDSPIVFHDGIVIELRNDGAALKLGTLSLFHYVFRGGIRLESGQASTHHASVVDFNRQLKCLTEEAEGRGGDQTD